MSRFRSPRAPVFLAAAALLTSANVALAQMKTEVTPFAGYYIASDLYGTAGARLGLENAGMWGARLTRSSAHGGWEFAYTRSGSDARLTQVLAGQPRADIGHVNYDSYDLNFLGYGGSGRGRATPFGSIGIGWTVTHPEINPDFVNNAVRQPASSTLFSFNFGLGTKVEMSPKVSLRLDARWRVTDTAIVTSSGIWCDPYGYCYSYASDWYNSGELSGGLSFALN